MVVVEGGGHTPRLGSSPPTVQCRADRWQLGGAAGCGGNANRHSRTHNAEQTEFLTKALRDEISPEGLAVLRREGKFGALTDLFPQEAKTWAAQAGVKPEDCVAFRMERDNIRAEVVLVREGEVYRVVRCNNVKQLAAAKL
jgi:hypothetical protein